MSAEKPIEKTPEENAPEDKTSEIPSEKFGKEAKPKMRYKAHKTPKPKENVPQIPVSEENLSENIGGEISTGENVTEIPLIHISEIPEISLAAPKEASFFVTPIEQKTATKNLDVPIETRRPIEQEVRAKETLTGEESVTEK